MTDDITVVHDDCLTALAAMDENSIDAIVTDPPYGLEFMGRAWDRLGDVGQASHAGPTERDGSTVFGRQRITYSASANRRCLRCEHWEYSGSPCECGADAIWPNVKALEGRRMQEWHQRWAEQALRVLKPGGHALCFGGSRTFHRMTCGLEDAGFEIRDTIAWMYGSGFPKSLDVGKAIDRQRDDRADIVRVTSWLKRQAEARGFSRSEIDQHMGTNGMAGHWTTSASQAAVPKWEQWDILKRFMGLSDDMDAEVWRLNGRKGTPGEAWHEREVVGEWHQPGRGSRSPQQAYGLTNDHGTITAPATADARRWDGWGTALKPAHEPIVVARKPLAGTVAANVLEHGTGALNIDGTRIPHGDDVDLDAVQRQHAKNPLQIGGAKPGDEVAMYKPAGRWPANVVLDEAAADLLDQQTGDLGVSNGLHGTHAAAGRSGGIQGERDAREQDWPGYGDRGGASRFFYTAKASSADRPSGIWWCESCNSKTDKLEVWVNEDQQAATPPGTDTPHKADTTASSTTGDFDSPTTSSGNSTTDPSHQATRSTTATATSKTTGSKTSSSSPRPSTSDSIRDANDGTASGGSPALFAVNSSPSPTSTGTSPAKDGRSTAVADPATSPRSSKRNVCAACGSEVREAAHPTVKPVELMRWLVRLVTPPGGVVVDPFAGSGTTGVACVVEGRRAVLIEREAEYVAIIRRRLAQPLQPVLSYASEPGRMSAKACDPALDDH